jgi:hypothetical protein
MSKIRYYFQLHPLVQDRFGGYQYLTAQVEKPYDGWMPRIGSHSPGTFHQLLANSDKVILCEGDSIRYIKHREMDPEHAVIDPDEFMLIKMQSVEFD